MTEGQVNRASGLVAAFEQLLDRFHHGDDLFFDVQGAAAPDKAIGYLARKGRVGPFFEGCRIGRNYIQVPGKQDWRQLRVVAFPGVEQGVILDRLAFQAGVQAGIHTLQSAVQFEQGFSVGLVTLQLRDSLAADSIGEVLGHDRRFNLQPFDRLNRLERAGKGQGAHEDEGDYK